MKLFYRKKEWYEFRKQVIKLDGNKCTHCGRSSEEVVLQVHHKKYISGKKPWEYEMEDCITLCQGCHAAEHGKIMPKTGWLYFGYEDLGDLIGSCELCMNSIRHAFVVYNPDWGTLTVGTVCCDNLTEGAEASNLRRFTARKIRFLKSKRWHVEENTHTIRQKKYDVEIGSWGVGFYLKIHNRRSKTFYRSVDDAKVKAFEVIENGVLDKHFGRKNP